MLLSNNTIVLSEGAIPVIENQTILEFDVRGTHFPIRGGGPPVEGDNNSFGFSAITKAKGEYLYIDLQDGGPVREIYLDDLIVTGGGYSTLRLGALRFADVPDSEGYKWNYGTVRKIKIWFSNPYSVNALRFSYMNLHGIFPKYIANYNLDTLVLSSTNHLEVFPNSLQGGIFRNLTLANVGPAFTDFIPNWIFQSYISTLTLQGSFDFSRSPDKTGFNRLHLIEGLNFLDIASTKMLDSSIDDSLKLAPRLSSLHADSNYFTKFPQEFANIKLTNTFRFGSINKDNPISGTYPEDMSALLNLRIFWMNQMIGDLWSTAVFPQFKDWNFNEFLVVRTYKTQKRTDEFVANVYNEVNLWGEKENIKNGKLRVKSFRLFYPPYPLDSDFRPTGLYQMPEGFVLGVSNGNPKTPMEMIWVLVQQYYWTVRLRSQLNELPGLETLAP